MEKKDPIRGVMLVYLLIVILCMGACTYSVLLSTKESKFEFKASTFPEPSTVTPQK